MTDESILAKECGVGDATALEELYRRYSPRLLSLCLRYSDDRAQAEDAMHDAFVKIMGSIERFRYGGEGSLYSWMARITVNRCFDSARKRRRIRSSTLDETLIERLPDESSGDSEGADDIPAEVLREMVESLPEAYRTVFKLFAVDGMSHKEIGELLHIREKTSSSNYFRARALLAKKVREYHEREK